MTFKELFLMGQCYINAIDAWTEIWHCRSDARKSLQEFLGLNDKEYQAWLLQGNADLAQQINSGHLPEYGVAYLGWDELTDQLQEVVDAELGLGYTVELRRQDYYYWDMILLQNAALTCIITPSTRKEVVSWWFQAASISC